ncbi:putative IS3 transposase [Yersinia aldovae]|uniref:IS3 transposase n=1 Tax=Yersinia aldovae TaxID=29483 RepID=A0ABM9SZA2_YERAL|nr:putative IS3 transposase [Yersinia aldovae]
MIKNRRIKRTFSPEFKFEAIEQVVEYQRDVREVAQALELNPDHLRIWIQLYKQEIQGIECQLWSKNEPQLCFKSAPL